MKTVATIEARMDSSRLPGKILKDVLGRPMLEHLVERVRRSEFIDDVIVATTTAPNDAKTEEVCTKIGVSCFRGSSDDVLDRVLNAAKSVKADVIVELTGDCPLLDPVEIDKVIKYYQSNQYDYVSNVLTRTYPRGLDTQVFSVDLLDRVSRLTTDLADRENVSLYIYEHPKMFKLGNVEAEGTMRRPDLRLTVDLPEDFELVSEIYKVLYPQNPKFSLTDVLGLIDNDPRLKELNAHIQQKAVR